MSHGCAQTFLCYTGNFFCFVFLPVFQFLFHNFNMCFNNYTRDQLVIAHLTNRHYKMIKNELFYAAKFKRHTASLIPYQVDVGAEISVLGKHHSVCHYGYCLCVSS